MGLVGPGLVGDATLTSTGVSLMMIVAVVAVGLAMMGQFVGRRDGAVLAALYVAAMLVLGLGNDDSGDQPAATSTSEIVPDSD